MAKISRRNLLAGGGMLLTSLHTRLLSASELFTGAESLATPGAARDSSTSWLRTARIIDAEAYDPPFYPEMHYDPEKSVSIAKAIHANAFRYPAASYYANFPTRTKYPIAPKLAGDPMLETIRLCRAANMKVIAYIPLNHPFMAIRDANPDYPQWQRRDAHGNPMVTTHFGFTEYYEGCLNSPLRAQIFALFNEVLAYDVDVIYFDGPYQGMDKRAQFCHCQWCVDAYRKTSGLEIPAENGPLDQVATYTRWIDDDVCKKMLQELADSVRSKKLPVLYNNTSLLSRGWCRSRSFPVVDGFMFEAAETPEQKLFNLQLGQSTGKCIWTYAGYHSQYNREHLQDKSIRGWYSYPVDGEDLLMDGAVAFAAGTGVVYWSLGRLSEMTQPPLAYAEGRNIHDIFQLMDQHEEIVAATETSPQAGLLVGSQTIESYNAPTFVSTAYANGFHGIWSVMQSGSYTAEPFLDYDFDRQKLERYKLVYVSNAACLSASQCQMLADFVAAGGTLIATHRSGICDEIGRTQKARPLHDLLGIELTAEDAIEKPELYLQLPGKPDLAPQDPQIMPFRALSGTEVLATTWDLAHRQTLGPAITRRTHGKGQAIYIGSSLESIYEETHLPAVRDTLLDLMKPALADSQRYRAPYRAGLMTHYTASPVTILLHLLADTGDKTKKLRMTEEYLPLTDVAVAIRVPAGKKISSVHLLRAGKPVHAETRDGWINLTVERVLIHETVVVSLA